MVSAIVFDFDGTLVDSCRSIFDEYVRVAAQIGLRPITYREFAAQLGKPWDAALEGLWPGVDKEKFTAVYRRDVEKTPILDGVLAVLCQLKKSYKLALLTSRGEKSTHTILAAVGLKEDVFDHVFAKESLAHHKPDPRALIESAEKMRLNLSDIIYIGDSVVDAECAKKAGAVFVGVLSGGTQEQDFRNMGVEHVLKSVADLPKVHLFR